MYKKGLMTVLAIVAVAVGGFSTAHAGKKTYKAWAIEASGGAWGYSNRMRSQKAAEGRALWWCKRHGGKKCTVRLVLTNGECKNISYIRNGRKKSGGRVCH